MPTWIVHGFRWPRAAIRIHIILQNLDDAAPEWLMAPATAACMTENFKKQWPEDMAKLPGFRLIEQYDPDDLTTKDQPHAYVCDQVHEIRLGIDFDELRGGGIGEEQWAAIAELRDKVAPGEKLGWFVVVNGDVERWAPGMDGEDEDTETEATQSQFTPKSQRSSVGKASDVSGHSQGKPQRNRSLKSWIGGKLKKSKSGRDLRADATEPVPPLPPISPRHGLQASQTNGKSTISSRQAS